MSERIDYIKVDAIRPNPNNPRKNFDQAELEKLAQSILDVGMLQPVLVVNSSEPDETYRLVAGERRLRAAQLAGLATIPTIVKKLTPEQEAEVMLIENLQRKDLDPIEEARAYQVLLKEHEYTQETLGDKLGVSQAHIANRMRLLELPEAVQENISREIISPSAARELLACKKVGQAVIEKVAQAAADAGMTVKQVAQAAANAVWSSSRQLEPPPAHQPGHGGPNFDTEASGCAKCKKKAMLRYPWADNREELRCLDSACYDEKQKEASQKAQDEREAELLAKYPDAIIVDDLEQKIRKVYRRDIQDYCSAKECEHFRIGRWRGRSYIDSICLAPDSCDDCLKALEASRKREKEEKDASAAAEIEQLVGRKLNGMVFTGVDKSVMVYIAGAILSWFEDYQHHDDLASYLKRVAGPLPEEWKDGLPCNADVWPHLLPVLEGLSENQLARIIFEWPALALGIETPGGMVNWFLKDIPVPKEPAPKVSERVCWILDNSCGDINYDANIPRLTNDELTYCLEHEDRKSGMRKLLAEAKKRGTATLPRSMGMTTS